MNYFSHRNTLLLIIGLMQVYYLFPADQKKRNTPCGKLTEWCAWVKNGFHKEPLESLFPHECEQQKAIYKSIIEKKYGSRKERYYSSLKSICNAGGHTCVGVFLSSAKDITLNGADFSNISSHALLGATACFIGANCMERAYIRAVIKRYADLNPASEVERMDAGLKDE